jgi:capreomycidine synthase
VTKNCITNKRPHGKITPALLEGWMRLYYFSTDIDIGSSGVESFSLRELRKLIGITQKELDSVVFNDSWTHGAPSLREAIARWWNINDPEQVLVTHGSSEGIYLIMNALLQSGDEVIVLDPCYQQLSSIAESIGCHLKHWRLRFEHGFVPQIDEVRSLINSKTRMVVVNFPHNPTGTSLTRAQQRELLDAVAEVGAYLVWDAAFAALTYDAEPLPAPNLSYARSVSLGTLSKCYGLPGLRVGWCIAPREVLDRCIDLRDYITLHLSPLVELIAQRAIEHADRLLNIRLQQSRTNLELLSTWVERHGKMVKWVRPQGGVCAFPHLPQVHDAESFCHRLARQGVLLVPGTCFNHPSHVRLGFGGSTEELTRGLSWLSKLLEEEITQ